MSIRIGIGSGLTIPMTSDIYWEWVQLCEDSGIDSIWHSEQIVGPVLDPVVLLSALAARTKRMRFGTNAIVAAFRDPITLAKEFATIDYLAPGRLLPVFGVGNAHDPYWAATGKNPGERGRKSNEAITLLRALLERDDEVSFHGEFFTYQGPAIWPHPARPLPLWIGGDSAAAIQRTATHGDGWLGGLTPPDKAAEVVAGIKAAAAETGRTIDIDHYGVTVPFRIGDPDDPAVEHARARLRARLKLTERDERADLLAVGDPDDIAELFHRYIAAGVHKFVAVPIVNDADDLLAQTEALASKILPKVEDRVPA
jgi:probable F420-dependent oxidoreductase